MDARNESEADRLYRTTGVPKNCVVMDVPGDGACMFHAVLIAFFYAMRDKIIRPSKRPERLSEASKKLRDATVDYIVRHYRRPLAGVPGNMSGRELIMLEYSTDSASAGVKGPKTYAEYMGDPKTFGGETELHGLSGLLRVGICIHNTAEKDVRGIYYNTIRGASVSDSRRNDERDIVIHLAYDPNIQHYAAILPLTDAQYAERKRNKGK